MSDTALLKARSIPAPHVNPETEAFWDAARDGRFVIRACLSCGRSHWYPRAICPFCASGETEWRAASGLGTIYSCSAMLQAAEPYVIAYVTLDEGPTMLTNIVECDPRAVRIGQRVSVVFQASEDGTPVPMFRPFEG
jgi:uncharacterized protein